ncbi:MAG: phage terminase large subunit family protein, partial [Pyramidobacter sp.]|nr:phage terminase large subunit family protein [Pyramidobacter sp.]
MSDPPSKHGAAKAPTPPDIWTRDELRAFRPPKKLDVSEWADRTRVLDGASSSMPGPWRTARTPYLREIMDSFRDRRLKKIVLCFGTQLGKSETILNLIGYVVDQDPGPALLVYPTDQLARSISKNRIAPMLISSPALLEKWNIDQSENLELQFQGMYLALVGANSPSKLASRPIRYLFYDEIDKFPERSGADANPIDLAAERTKNFANSKQVMASSPTLNSGPIWQNFLAAQVRKKYFVPCPQCGAPLTLEHRGIKWPEEFNSLPPEEREKRVLTEAWYQCPYCGAHIDDMQKY